MISVTQYKKDNTFHSIVDLPTYTNKNWNPYLSNNPYHQYRLYIAYVSPVGRLESVYLDPRSILRIGDKTYNFDYMQKNMDRINTLIEQEITREAIEKLP